VSGCLGGVAPRGVRATGTRGISPDPPAAAHPVPRRPAAPMLLDPILAAWERADRRRRRVRPARPGALLGIEMRRHAGPALRLGDGTVIRSGDLVGELHLDNARVRAVVRSEGWQGIAAARRDLAAVARWTARTPPARRPIAFHASTLLGPLAARAGFEVTPRPRSNRARLDEWFLRWLMARWSPDGRARLGRGHGQLREADCWLSASALVAERDRNRGRAVV
jgi:peptidoglycan-N-acetylglucosamine deacetylase